MDEIIKYFLLFCLLFTYVRIAVPYVGFFVRYMFNEPTKWNRLIERPRLLFYGIGLLFMHTSYYPITYNSRGLFAFYLILTLLVFLLGFGLAQVTWTKKFKNVFIPAIKRQLKSSRNFNISASKSHMDKLYDKLVRYDILKQDRTSKEDFYNALSRNWHAHASKIHFNLDSPSAREFYEFFIASFPNNTMTLKDFFEASDVIRRPDGRPYKYSTIKNSPTRTPVSKRNSDLEFVFSSFQD